MLTRKQIHFIKQNINEQYFDVDKLIRYLNTHAVVGNEVFSYITRNELNEAHGWKRQLQWLDDRWGYSPVSVNVFIKRIPFYFYIWDGDWGKHCGALSDLLYSNKFNASDFEEAEIENLYKDLEYLYYEQKICCYDIFNYVIEQMGVITQRYFPYWVHYLRLCEKLNWHNKMPKRLITAYNLALEQSNMRPIVYGIHEVHPGELFMRKGKKIIFEGRFPCDDDGKPIMKWIGLKVVNAESVECKCKMSEDGELIITIKPNTIIFDLDLNNNWYQIYAGPQNMKFDCTILRVQREYLGLTQQQVADAVEANVRTYQKWENGESNPDGHYLIRLLNWLDIPDIQLVTEYR